MALAHYRLAITKLKEYESRISFILNVMHGLVRDLRSNRRTLAYFHAKNKWHDMAQDQLDPALKATASIIAATQRTLRMKASDHRANDEMQKRVATAGNHARWCRTELEKIMKDTRSLQTEHRKRFGKCKEEALEDDSKIRGLKEDLRKVVMAIRSVDREIQPYVRILAITLGHRDEVFEIANAPVPEDAPLKVSDLRICDLCT